MGALRAVAEPRPPIEVVVMRVVTRCETADDFIASFHPFVTDSTCFIPTTTLRTPGIETGFSIRLADGAPMLRGLCVVLDAWADTDNPYKRPGVWIGLRGLTAESKLVHQRLLLARMTAEEEQGRPTVRMPPLFPDPAPSSAFVLPANPLTDMDDADLASFVDCMMYEDDDQDTTRPIAAPAHVPPAEATEPIAVRPPVLPDPSVLPDATVPTAAPITPIAVDESQTVRCEMPPGRGEIATLLGVAPIAAVPVAIAATSPAVATRVEPTMVISRIRVTETRPWWQRAMRTMRYLFAKLRRRVRPVRSLRKRERLQRLTLHR